MTPLLALYPLFLGTVGASGATAPVDPAPLVLDLQIEEDVDATLMTPAFEAIRPHPRGLTCSYTCSSGGTNWTLICNENTEEACCDIADQACPYIEPGSTGTASCHC